MSCITLRVRKCCTAGNALVALHYNMHMTCDMRVLHLRLCYTDCRFAVWTLERNHASPVAEMVHHLSMVDMRTRITLLRIGFDGKARGVERARELWNVGWL